MLKCDVNKLHPDIVSDGGKWEFCVHSITYESHTFGEIDAYAVELSYCHCTSSLVVFTSSQQASTTYFPKIWYQGKYITNICIGKIRNVTTGLVKAASGPLCIHVVCRKVE